MQDAQVLPQGRVQSLVHESLERFEVVSHGSLLKRVAAFAFMPALFTPLRAASPENAPARRLRPSDPEWPDKASWAKLNEDVGGRLVKVNSPLSACREAPDGRSCGDLFRELKNPYFISDEVGLTQTAGWMDAWESQPSVYAVAAETTGDVVAAVNFARSNNLRLVVKAAATAISADRMRRILC